MAFLKNEPLVKDVPINGYIVRSPLSSTVDGQYDVKTGKIEKVV